MRQETQKRYYIKTRENKLWDDLMSYEKDHRFWRRWDEVIRLQNEHQLTVREIERLQNSIRLHSPQEVIR